MTASRASRSGHVRAVYEMAASRYDRYYRRAWLFAAGGAAEAAMLDHVGQVASVMDRPKALDAGAGTGAFSRRLQAFVPVLHPVLVDLSPAMLGQASDLNDPRAIATLGALPFGDDSFDIIVCAWVIETVDDPRAVVAELLRVLRPGGLLTYSFCSRPARLRDRWRTGPIRAVVHAFFSGHFLSEEQSPFHACAMSRRRAFSGGAVTVVSLGKCCTVAPAVPATRTVGATRPVSDTAAGRRAAMHP